MKTKLDSDLERFKIKWRGCQDCRLAKTRTNQVFGRRVGNYQLGGIVLIGEAPGKSEDLSGLAFMGKAGKKLDRLLMSAEIEETYILNTVCCRPPLNRDPDLLELRACLARLQEQVKILSPRIIVTLGRVATLWLCGENPEKTPDKAPLGVHIDQIYQLSFSDMMFWQVPTYHPSYLLRRKNFTPKVVDHLILARELLEV